MKKLFFLFALCMVVSMLPAQKKMYVWVNEVPTEYSVLDVDSITFADAESTPTPEPTQEPQPLKGVFSVSPTKQVRFSPGNLQYTQSTDTWSFASEQYEMLGTDNVEGGTVGHGTLMGQYKDGTALADKIDLFNWSGTTSTTKWGVSEYNDDNSGDFVDWGQNIGDGTTWRTLTSDEWRHLSGGRPVRINLAADGRQYVNGVILFPDNWVAPEGVVFLDSPNPGSSDYYSKNTFTLNEWEKLEIAGAVFLPASGCRWGLTVGAVQDGGDYWSVANLLKWDDTNSFGFYSGNITWCGEGGRDIGRAVRLVQDIK